MDQIQDAVAQLRVLKERLPDVVKQDSRTQINFFLDAFSLAKKTIFNPIKIQDLVNDGEPYQSRLGKTITGGHKGNYVVEPAKLIEITKTIIDYKHTYGVTDEHIQRFKEHLQVPVIPLSVVDLNQQDVLSGNFVPIEKIVRRPDVFTFFSGFTKLKADGLVFNVPPFNHSIHLHGFFKKAQKQIGNFTMIVREVAPDNYSMLHGTPLFRFQLINEQNITLPSSALEKFYQLFISVSKLGVDKKKRKAMDVVVCELEQIIDLDNVKNLLDISVLNYYYLFDPSQHVLVNFEKVFIGYAQVRTMLGEASRVNVPNAIVGMNLKYQHMGPCKCQRPYHTYVVAGSGNFNSNMCKRLYSQVGPNDQIDLIDTSYVYSGVLSLAGPIIRFNHNDALLYDYSKACCVITDITAQDEKQSVMTNDYYYTNLITTAIYEKIPMGASYYLMLGIARNTPNIFFDFIHQYSGSPEFFVVGVKGVSNKFLHLHIENIMASKFRYNQKYKENLVKGKMTIPEGQVVSFNNESPGVRVMNPKHARYKPYSKSSLTDRLIVSNVRLYDNRNVVIPEEYLPIWQTFKMYRTEAEKKILLDSLPIDIAQTFNLKTLESFKLTSSKVRATLGVSRTGMLRTNDIDQLNLMERHPEFFKTDANGIWHTSISTSTEVALEKKIIDGIYARRDEIRPL